MPTIRRRQIIPKKKLTHEEKQHILLQEFLSARNDSSHSILKKFDIFPKTSGEAFFLKDGKFIYSIKDIEQMLVIFTNASETACGRRNRSCY